MVVNVYFEMGNGLIWMDDFQCEDYEIFFVKCFFNVYRVNNCDYEKDVVVMCNV